MHQRQSTIKRLPTSPAQAKVSNPVRMLNATQLQSRTAQARKTVIAIAFGLLVGVDQTKLVGALAPTWDSYFIIGMPSFSRAK